MTSQSSIMTVARNGGELRLAEDLPQTDGATATLRTAFQTILRRRWLILGTLLLLNVTAFVAVRSLTPRYTAEASLLIGPRQARVVDLQSVIAGLSGESDVIESEVQVLRSRDIIRRAVERLGLDGNPEFNSALREPGRFAKLKETLTDRLLQLEEALPSWVPQFWRKAEPDEPIATLSGSSQRPRDPLAEPIDQFLRRLWVTPQGRSRVLRLGFESTDPALAAAAANTLVDTYIAEQLGAKVRATEQAQRWLADRVAELRERMVTADRAVEEYRRALGITQGVNGTLLNEQMSAANAQLARASAERADAEARLQAAGVSLSEVQDTPLLRSLREQESALQTRISSATRPGTLDNEMARNQLRDVQDRIRVETERTINGGRATGLRRAVLTARTQEALLMANLGDLQREAARSNEGTVELRALQHEADANRALYDRLLARSKETHIEAGLQQPDAQVLSHAEVPEQPSFPNPVIVLPVIFVASCVLAALLVFVLESLDRGFTTLDQVEQSLGVPGLGVVPRLKRSIGSSQNPATYVLEHPASVFSEAMRSLYTSLMLSGQERPPKVVLMASALPGEGKSSTAQALARLMASCGKKVVLVDCDLVRPTVHQAFGTERGPGLVDYLAGNAEAQDVLRRDAISPAWCMPVGSGARTSPDLFASNNMRNLIQFLSDRFDLVILDSAPMLAVSDTRNLCRLADRTVLLVRWMDTRRMAVQPALRQIAEAGGIIAGVLLSQIDLQRYMQFAGTTRLQRRLSFYRRGRAGA
ncbi:GumC family protein [Roseomonas elaeocarpi]|uniref:non-specific protein-tyrosine kinase n=1 Tax=Roseomonas elaeocarpi TaxID=907779 RepID=A0ABV6JLN3_9PROT